MIRRRHPPPLNLEPVIWPTARVPQPLHLDLVLDSLARLGAATPQMIGATLAVTLPMELRLPDLLATTNLLKLALTCGLVELRTIRCGLSSLRAGERRVYKIREPIVAVELTPSEGRIYAAVQRLGDPQALGYADEDDVYADALPGKTRRYGRQIATRLVNRRLLTRGIAGPRPTLSVYLPTIKGRRRAELYQSLTAQRPAMVADTPRSSALVHHLLLVLAGLHLARDAQLAGEAVSPTRGEARLVGVTGDSALRQTTRGRRRNSRGMRHAAIADGVVTLMVTAEPGQSVLRETVVEILTTDYTDADIERKCNARGAETWRFFTPSRAMAARVERISGVRPAVLAHSHRVGDVPARAQQEVLRPPSAATPVDRPEQRDTGQDGRTAGVAGVTTAAASVAEQSIASGRAEVQRGSVVRSRLGHLDRVGRYERPVLELVDSYKVMTVPTLVDHLLFSGVCRRPATCGELVSRLIRRHMLDSKPFQRPGTRHVRVVTLSEDGAARLGSLPPAGMPVRALLAHGSTVSGERSELFLLQQSRSAALCLADGWLPVDRTETLRALQSRALERLAHATVGTAQYARWARLDGLQPAASFPLSAMRHVKTQEVRVLYGIDCAEDLGDLLNLVKSLTIFTPIGLEIIATTPLLAHQTRRHLHRWARRNKFPLTVSFRPHILEPGALGLPAHRRLSLVS